MNLSRIFRPELIAVGKKFKDKEEALKEVAKLAMTSPDAADCTEEAILEALAARENLYSTGFGHGIAIPHCKSPDVKDFVTGVITVPDGVDFDSEDNLDVKIIIFIVGPVRDSNEHIRLLSLIAQKLHEPGLRDSLIAETDPAKIPDFFAQKQHWQLSPAGHSGRDLMHIVVQDEDWFNEILQIVSGVENSQVIVADAQYEGSYLAQIPIFSNVWSDQNHDFCKMIVAVQEKSVTGDIVRRIDKLVGGLDDCDRVLLMVQHLFYSAGSLQF